MDIQEEGPIFEVGYQERVIELGVRMRGAEEHIRIEVFRRGDHFYTTHYIRRQVVTSASNDEAFGAGAWVRLNLPWTHGRTPDEAIVGAVSFLRERVGSGT